MPGVGTTHHVLLDGHYYLVRPGSYQKRPAPTFGARFATGDPDFNNLSIWQHWAQRCFIGGIDQDLWADDAMYDDGIGIDTSEHERVTLARQLLPGSGSNWGVSAAGAHAAQGFKAVVYNSKLYVLTLPDAGTESRLWRYDKSGDGWTRITALDSKDICGRSVTVWDGKLWIGGYSVASGKAKVVYDDGNLGSWSTLALPSATEDSATFAVRAMRGFQQRLYIAYGSRIWRFKEDGAAYEKDGNTVFYKANAASSSNYIVNMEVHLGFLYMISQNGHIHRTDGNTTFDIWNWDGQTEGVAIRSFDGRLFVLTYEFTETTNVGYGVLYQMSGSAVTQLKRWGDETNATRIGNMTVYNRRLWYGASNGLGIGQEAVFGVAGYDPIEDSHCVVFSNQDAVTYARGSAPYNNWLVDDQIFWEGHLFAFVRGHGAFKSPYKHRDFERGVRRFDISAAGASLAPQNGGWFTTSTYDAGTPGVKKLWRKLIVDVTVPANTGYALEYSIDNGASWVSFVTSSGGGVAALRHDDSYWFNNLISTSFKIRMTLRSTSASVSPILHGFVVSYLPVPEPNWMWTFTVVLSEKQVLLDGTEATVDTEAELLFLDAAFREKQMLSFTDAQGVQWADIGPGVIIYDIVTSLRDLNQPLEGEVTITLLEAVEYY